MTPERWRQVERLCHEALARPAEERAAFLADAAAGDHELRREVETLIAQEPRAAGFMSAPAVFVAASATVPDARGTLVGQRFRSYVIRSRLGAGGMGEVYRALDETLGREVAIKVLSPAFTRDPERRSRFEREARLLATLNHPNIGAIYGVEDAGDVRALVLELVEGETLAERLTRSDSPGEGHALPLPDALAIARQVVQALDAAHEKGIVHRDLKPANIKITPDGVVKVLDFGLAKAASLDGWSPDPTKSPTVTVAETREGMIMGTAAYLSPEQARGKAVDKRADIWAFGCVLYEMLTGRLAFQGDTASDMIAKILEREPDWSALPPTTPASIRRVLYRCLVKDPKQRVRDIGDVAIEIDAVDQVLPGTADAPIAPAAARQSKTAWLPWIAVAALAVGGGVWEFRRPLGTPDSPLANAQFSRFTDWEGTEAGAQISPDGKFVAFIGDHDGKLDLWVSQVGTGRFLNLTKDRPPLSAPNAVLRTIGFSGDGAEIWFTQAGDSSAPKWLIPLSGGTPRAFLGQGAAAPSWSPDDARLTYFTNGDGDPLFIADRTSANARPIMVDKPDFFASGVHNHNPVWSPDGQWLYFAHGLDPAEEMNVWRIRPSGGTPEQLTEVRAAANFLAPIDARTLLYVARAEDRSGPWLWSLDVETKVTRRVTSGIEHYSSVSASRDGLRIVATVSNPTVTLWRVPLLDRQAEDRDVRPYALPNARALSPRFGGTSLFYLSGQGASDGLWRFQAGNSVEVWKASNDSLSEPPAVSHDGSRVAIIVRQDGKLRLTTMSEDGTNARTLAPSITIQGSIGGSADWSPDGAWIVVAGADEQGGGLFKIPVNGGVPVRLASGLVTSPVWSPDGTLIVYGGPIVGGQIPLRGVRPDGTPIDLGDLRADQNGGHRFLSNGTLVYKPRSQSLDFWLFDLTTKKTRPLTHLGDHGALRTFDITPDGKEIVFERSRDNSDIVLIDLPK